MGLPCFAAIPKIIARAGVIHGEAIVPEIETNKNTFNKDIYKTWTSTNVDALLPAVDRQRDNNMSASDLFLIK